MKKLKKIMALALAMSLALAPAAHAAGNEQTVTKVLENRNTNAVVPTETFTFEVKASDAVQEVPSNVQPETYPTPIIKGVEGAVTVAAAAYTDKTAELTQKPAVTIQADKFGAPGIYRYEVTEKKGALDGMTYSDTTYVLDVYIVNGDGGAMKVEGVVSFEKGKPAEGKKDMTFTNIYETKDLTITKNVTGNQGDKNKAFTFTVKVTDANPNMVTGFKYQIGDSIGTENFQTAEVKNGVATIEGGIKSGQSIKIFGLSPKDTYTVEEQDANQGGYKTTGEVKQATEMGAQDKTVTVTNDRTTTVPTGVISTIAPFVLVIAAVGVFAVVYFKKRRVEA